MDKPNFNIVAHRVDNHRLKLFNIKTNKYISDLQFDNSWSNDFRRGEEMAKVRINTQGYNFINIEGELLSPNQWFDDADNFRNGFAVVNYNKKKYIINTKGDIVSEINNNSSLNPNNDW